MGSKEESANESKFKVLATPDELKPQNIRRSTTPDQVPTERHDKSNTVIVGMGPVGLASALAAIARGESVTLITDREMNSELGVRQQVLGVDAVMDWVASLVDPELLETYKASGQLTRTMYQPVNKDGAPDGEPVPYWGFSTGALERLLVEELNRRIDLKSQPGLVEILTQQDNFFVTGEDTDEPGEQSLSAIKKKHAEQWAELSETEQNFLAKLSFIELHNGEAIVEKAKQEVRQKFEIGINIVKVDKIPPQLSSQIDISLQKHGEADVETQLSQIKELRKQIDITDGHITLGHVVSINGQTVDKQCHQFPFEDLITANGAKQQAEKSLAGSMFADDVHIEHPAHKAHVAAIFHIKKNQSVQWGKNNEAPIELDAQLITDMVTECKANKSLTTRVPMEQLRQYGWSSASRPHQQVYATGADRDGEDEYCYIGCEYPEDLKPQNLMKYVEIAATAYSSGAKQQDPSLEQIPTEIRHKLMELAVKEGELAKLTYGRQRASIELASLSKELIRGWSRLLLRDALPQSVCTFSMLSEPTYEAIDKGKQVLSTSAFDLGFAELGQSVLVNGNQTEGYNAVMSMGDGRMFPLYTTGTGAQTGLKLAQAFHQAKEKYSALQQELKQQKQYSWLFDQTTGELLTETQVEPTKQPSYQQTLAAFKDKANTLVADTYAEYHANARAVVDEIRDVQAKWIEARNKRFYEAQKTFDTVSSATDLGHKIDAFINHYQSNLRKTCRQGVIRLPTEELSGAVKRERQELITAISTHCSLKRSQLPTKIADHMMKVKQCMEQTKEAIEQNYSRFTDQAVEHYEDIPQQTLGAEADAAAYSKNLAMLCAELHKLQNELSELKSDLLTVEESMSTSVTETTTQGQQLLQDLHESVQKISDLLNCGLFKSVLATMENEQDEQLATEEQQQPTKGGRWFNW